MKKIDEIIDRDEKILNLDVVGQKITEARWLTKEEAEECGWTYQPIQITLENGVILVPMSDDEGNEAGAMATNLTELNTIYVNRD